MKLFHVVLINALVLVILSSCGKEEPQSEIGIVIESPQFEQEYNAGESVKFNCLFKNMTDISNFKEITWTSELDGELGSKNPIVIDTLSDGRHGITVQVKTQDGRILEDYTVVIVKRVDLHAQYNPGRQIDRNPLSKTAIDTILKTTKNFSGKNLSGLDLSNYDLSNCNFHTAFMVHSDFSKTNFRNSILDSAMINHSNFSDSNLKGVSLKGVSLSNVNFTNVNLSKKVFLDRRMDGINFSGCDLSYTNFTNCSLTNTNFSNTKLNKNILKIAIWLMQISLRLRFKKLNL